VKPTGDKPFLSIGHASAVTLRMGIPAPTTRWQSHTPHPANTVSYAHIRNLDFHHLQPRSALPSEPKNIYVRPRETHPHPASHARHPWRLTTLKNVERNIPRLRQFSKLTRSSDGMAAKPCTIWLHAPQQKTGQVIELSLTLRPGRPACLKGSLRNACRQLLAKDDSGATAHMPAARQVKLGWVALKSQRENLLD